MSAEKRSSNRTALIGLWVGLVGVVLALIGSYIGLFVAPPDRHMGDVQRMLYVHVPTAKNSLLIFFFAFCFAVANLWTGKKRLNDYMVGSVETGVVLNVLLLIQGMLWARPTWGIWWTWGDVRLVFSFLMLLLFAGVLALRSLVEDPIRRATWTSVATIIAFVDVPIVYFCVRWWRSLHQVQSSPATVDAAMVLPMRINLVAILFIGIWMIVQRAEIERRRRLADDVSAPAPVPLQEKI
jgi:heme exporter protein C